MTEIQKLEAEINEKKMLLKHLKSLENPHLQFDSLCDSLRAKSAGRLFISEVVDSLRSLALSVASARLKDHAIQNGHDSIHTYPKIKRVKELSSEQISLLNDMLAEIGPIVADYMWRFAVKQEKFDE